MSVTRTVVPDQRHDFATAHLKIYILQCLHATEVLADTGDG